MNDRDRADQLDRDWDAFLSEGRMPKEAEFGDMLRSLHRAPQPPRPSAQFRRSLRARLFNDLPQARRMRRAPGRNWVMAAVSLAAVFAVLVGYAFLVADRNDPDAPAIAIATSTSMPTAPVVAAEETPTVPVAADESPTAVSATVEPDVTSAPTEEPTAVVAQLEPTPTDTVEPEATVPLLASPPAQMAARYPLNALSQMVRASQAIVVARPLEEVIGEPGLQFRAMSIENPLWGLVGGVDDIIYVIDYPDLTVGDTALLFLETLPTPNGPMFGLLAGQGVLPLRDDVVIAPNNPMALVARSYIGTPLNELIQQIVSARDLVNTVGPMGQHWGWSIRGKSMSYVMPLPASPEATLPIMAMGSPRVSWGSALEASTAAGLDFSGFVGEEVQIVTYFVQRDPALPPVRMLRLAVLLHGDDVIGAWYMADGERRAYSLTELDELNGLSLEYQLPPENVVPTSAIVNVAEFYELAQTETFQLCWPECSDVPVTVRFRDALVAALTADLELLSIDSHPYPRSAEEMVQTPWRYAALNFGYADGGWITRYFLYDREAGLILLPSGAGWVHAPAAFVELMATVGPP